jgi:hypothetical protein
VPTGGQTELFAVVGPAPRTRTDKKERSMHDDNRVLSRRGARELNAEEIDRVGGSINTDTACTWDPKRGAADGDAFIGEC